MNKKELNKLEKQFLDTIEIAKKEVNMYLNSAEIELEKATQVCEKYGIPLCLGLNYLGKQDYMPSTFKEKWPEINIKDFEYDLDLLDDEFYHTGWRYSELCY